MSTYDNVTYNNAEQAAQRMTNEELVEAHIGYMRRDGEILAGGESRRGIIDDPHWTYVKYEARRRGIDLGAEYLVRISK